MAGPSPKIMKCDTEIVDCLDDVSSENESLYMPESDVDSENDFECVPEVLISEDGSAFVGDGWKAVEEAEKNPRMQHIFREVVGPKQVPPPDSPPIAYFNLFFTESLLSLFVTETNRYAKQYITTNAECLPPSSQKWKNVNVTEMKAFLACILNMGLNKKSTMSSYWSTEPSQSMTWFREMFSRQRFTMILRFFHLVDLRKCPNRSNPEFDPSLKYQPLINHANSVFQHHYTPHEQMSVDESLVGMNNKTNPMKHLPNMKQKLREIKLWMLCDAVSSYCLGFYSHSNGKSGKDKGEMEELGLGYTVVVKLLEIGNYLHKGHHVFVDTFLMSIPLALHLYSLGTNITGSVKKKIKFMGGIDMMLCSNMDGRKSVKYWKLVAFNIISRMVLNSYILYKENFKGPGKLLSRLKYIINIIEHLGNEWVSIRTVSDKVGVVKLNGRKEANCCVCSTKKKRKRSRTVCIRCNKGLHGECLSRHKCAL